MTENDPDTVTSSADASIDEPWVDPDDAPELNDEFFERADFYNGGELIRRGRYPGESGALVSVELPVELVQRFKSMGRGWERTIDVALRQWLQRHDRQSDSEPLTEPAPVPSKGLKS